MKGLRGAIIWIVDAMTLGVATCVMFVMSCVIRPSQFLHWLDDSASPFGVVMQIKESEESEE